MLNMNQGHSVKCHVCAEKISAWPHEVSTDDGQVSLGMSGSRLGNILRPVSGLLRSLLWKDTFEELLSAYS